MLTKIDIDSQYYKLHKHLINTNETPINGLENPPLSLLFDSEFRILAIGKNPMSIKALSGFDKIIGQGFKTQEMKEFPNLNIKRSECWKYRLNLAMTNWEQNFEIESIDELNNFILLSQKAFYLDTFYNILEIYRKKNIDVPPIQQHIYISKYLEAKEILEKNIKTDDLLEYPYITGYANSNGLTLQQAAKSVKVQHEIQSGFLSESENLRLKYKSLIVNETDVSKLKSHLDRFIIENERYGEL